MVLNACGYTNVACDILAASAAALVASLVQDPHTGPVAGGSSAHVKTRADQARPALLLQHLEVHLAMLGSAWGKQFRMHVGDRAFKPEPRVFLGAVQVMATAAIGLRCMLPVVADTAAGSSTTANATDLPPSVLGVDAHIILLTEHLLRCCSPAVGEDAAPEEHEMQRRRLVSAGHFVLDVHRSGSVQGLGRLLLCIAVLEVLAVDPDFSGAAVLGDSRWRQVLQDCTNTNNKIEVVKRLATAAVSEVMSSAWKHM